MYDDATRLHSTAVTNPRIFYCLSGAGCRELIQNRWDAAYLLSSFTISYKGVLLLDQICCVLFVYLWTIGATCTLVFIRGTFKFFHTIISVFDRNWLKHWNFIVTNTLLCFLFICEDSQLSLLKHRINHRLPHHKSQYFRFRC